MNIPTNDNIVFIDTEFTDLDPLTGELLSVALIKPNGEELYIELPYTADPHPWVKEHVLPFLSGQTTTKEDAVTKIRKFIGDSKPHLMAYIVQLDAVYWYDLFGSAQSHPAHKHPIDFASILFAHGFSSDAYSDPDFLKSINVDMEKKGRGHHALDDCRFLREVYYKFLDHLVAEDVVGSQG